MRERDGELKKSGDALRRGVEERNRAEVETEQDLRDTRILHDLAMQFAADGDTQPLYDKILEAAVAITYAAAGTIQLFNEETQELVMLAVRNLPPRLTEKFARVRVGSVTSCGQALLTGERTLIDFDAPDVPDPEGSCKMHVEAGLLSAQSTPLVTRSGRLIGMFTTHWRTHRRPADRELRLLDLLARQTADLIEHRRAEEALRESEDRFRRLAEATSEGVVIHRQGKILEANLAAALTCGYDPSEMVGLPILEFIAPESREALLSVVAAGREGTYDLVGLRKDGFTFPAEVTARNFDYKGQPARLVLYRDISKRKRMEEELRRRLTEFTVLHQASLGFSQLLAPDEVGQKIVNTLRHLPHWRRGSVWLVSEARQELYLLAHSDMGLTPEALRAELARVRSLVHGLGEGISGWVALHGEPIRTGDVRNDPRYIEADPAVRSELCVPLKVGVRTIGSINVESLEPDAFSEQDEQFLTILANTAAISIENSRLFKQLQQELTERERAERERLQLLREIVAVKEEERGRMARDLHDQVSQYLYALNMHIAALKRSSPGFRADERLSGLQETTAELARAVHDMGAELRPHALDDFGLEVALSDYVERWSERYGRPADFCVEGITGRFPAEIETTVFRVVQEALTNVIKHSGAERVSVIVEQRRGRLTAVVEDDGGGFDLEEVMNRPAGERRQGLLGMKERTALVGGELKIESWPGKGVMVTARIPVPPNIGLTAEREGKP